MGRGLAVAVVLHAGAGAALLLGAQFLAATERAPDVEVPATFEFVEPADPTHPGDVLPEVGGGPAATEAEGGAAVPPSPSSASPTAPVAPGPTASADLAEPGPPPEPPSAPPRPTQSPARPTAAAVRLGGTGLEAAVGAVAFGKGVVPATPESGVPNRPPSYPAEAARRGEAGTVVLTLHIAADGTVSAVEIAESSGSAALDRAARAALARWRFRPARRDGIAVSSEFSMRVTFEL
jgi:protein TonB